MFHNSREISAHQNNPAILRNDGLQQNDQNGVYNQEQYANESDEGEELEANGED